MMECGMELHQLVTVSQNYNNIGMSFFVTIHTHNVIQVLYSP